MKVFSIQGRVGKQGVGGNPCCARVSVGKGGHDELERFAARYQVRHLPGKGAARWAERVGRSVRHSGNARRRRDVSEPLRVRPHPQSEARG